MGVVWYDASWNFISNDWVTLNRENSVWNRNWKHTTAPANAVHASINFYKSGTTGRLFVDDVCFYVAPPDCGMTLTTYNATDPYTRDGKILLDNITAENAVILTGPENDYLSKMSEGGNGSLNNQSRWLKGLAAGSYTVQADLYNAEFEYICQLNETVTIAAGSTQSCSSTEIGGMVYGDYNANGQRDINEKTVFDVTVSAYDANGNVSGNSPVSIGSDGFYKITGLAAGAPYRLEFSWPDYYVRPGAVGASEASVQFANAGTCDNDMGLNYPADYCHTTNPYVAAPCYVNGDPMASAVSSMDALVAFPRNLYTTSTTSTQNLTPVHVATAGQIGSTFAEAYQNSTKTLFVGAFLRRFMGFGPLGTGGIYKIDMTNPAAPSVSNWIDLNTLGISTGNDPRDASAANSLAPTPTTPAYDAAAFNQVGKMSLGGMTFNDNADTLWFVNLFDRSLYGIRNVSPNTAPTASDIIGPFAINLPSGYACNGGTAEQRPFAVQFYKGKVYVGLLCSGETTPWQSQHLYGYVLQFDPQNAAAGFSVALDFPLGYGRYTYDFNLSSTFPWVSNTTSQGYVVQYLFTDIEFDVNGEMILVLGDRGGFQTGFQNFYADPTASDGTLIDGNSYGEILYACKTASGYVLGGNAGCPTAGEDITHSNEYYWGDLGPYEGDTINFREIIMGGAANFPSDGDVIASVQDPSDWYSGGVMALNNTIGSGGRRAAVYDRYSTGGAGKATGIGDVEILCDPAPIEVGERIFADYDGDGIQDANEPGIQGVVVGLYLTSGGTFVAYDTTDAEGHYIFKNLNANTGYTLRVDTAQTALAEHYNVPRDAGANDLIDNDGAFNGTYQEVSFTTYRPGYNDHSFDFGFRPTEICEDGIDNDGDGLVDFADPDCQGCPFLSDTSQVLASSDDAEEDLTNNTMDLTSTDLELGNENGNIPQLVGMRFTGIDVPQGARVYGAYIEFETDETDSGETSITFWGEATDDAATFTSVNNNITNRVKTTDSIEWNFIPAWSTVDEKHQTPDLSPIIQEIVDRGGWASGNSLVIMAQGTGERTAESFDGEAVAAPKLVVLYENCPRIDTCLNRVSDGLIALYNFQEGSGSVIKDVSGVGTPLDLVVQDPANTSWGNGCGFGINSGTILQPTGNSSKIIDSLKASNALTIEAWVRPASITQGGPARIVTLSTDTGNRNFTLGQEDDEYAARLRTTSTTNNGTPEVLGGTAIYTGPQHVVFTWDGSTGTEKLYVDGVEVSSGTRAGDLSNWDDTYTFAIGDEISGGREWLGDLFYVAIYNKALSAAEVDSNFNELYCCNINVAADFDCESGTEVELVMAGIENDIPYTETYDTPSNIDSVVVEVVYKGGSPGTTASGTDQSGTTYTANRNSFGSNAHLYRFHLPANTSSFTYNTTTNQNRAQSMVSYVFRNGFAGKQYMAEFTTIGSVNDVRTLSTILPERNDTQNIRVILPISEITYDDRHLTLGATIGGISDSQYRLWGPNGDGYDNGCCVDTVHLYLRDVPPDERILTVSIDATGGGQSYVIGATLWLAVSCGPEVCDNGVDDDLDGLIDCDDPDCGPATVINNPGPFCVPDDTIRLEVTAVPIPTSTNVVDNGDFAQGNTGYSSDYDSWAYAVTDNPNNHWSWAPSCTDFSGNDNLLVADGRTIPNQRVWYQTVTVKPNTDYEFSVQVLNFWNSNPPQIRLDIGGTQVGTTVTIPTVACDWTKVSGTWNSGANTSVTLAIYNDELAGGGNDFGLDEISLLEVKNIASYSWAGPNGYTATGNPLIRGNIDQTMAGTYYLTVSDSEGCTSTDSTDVVVANGVEICANGIDDDCDGFTDCYDLDCPDIENGGACPNRFNCDNTLFQTLEINGDYWFYEVQTAPTVALIPRMNLTAAGVTDDINATILSPTDGYVYFLELHTPFNLWRLDGDLNLVNLGEIQEFPIGVNFFPNAAGVGLNGEYYVRDATSGDFWIVDIGTVTASLHCDMTPFASGSNNIGDFAYNPIDGKYYGYRDSTQTMYIFDPNACTLTPKPMETMVPTALGSFYFSADGKAYGYENGSGHLFCLDVLADTVGMEIAGTATPTAQTDGCSCDGVKLTKNAPDVCAGSTLTIEYEFSNFYRLGLDSIYFSDTLTDGLTFISQPYDITGNVQINSSTVTGNATIAFVIDSLTRGTGSFKINVNVPANVPDGTIISQNAWIKNLPNILGNEEASDDPDKPSLFDPTDITVYQPAVSTGIDNDTVCVGATVNLSATPTGGLAPYTYAWTGPNSFSSTAQNPSISNVNASNTGAYTLVLTDSLGCTATDSETLVINPDPSISAHPQNDSICAIYGSYLLVNVAGGTGNFTYDWQYNNGGTWEVVTNNIPPAVIYSNLNTDSLAITPFGTAGAYQYRVLVTDAGAGCGALTSNTAEILVSSVIQITGTQPENDTICVDGQTSFTVTASQPGFPGSLKYQWQYNNGGTWQSVANNQPAGAFYQGKKSSTLNIRDITAAGEYQYRVEIDSKESGCDKSYSAIVTLVVAEDPSITASGGTTICTGGTATLNAATTGGAKTCSIQWQSSPNGSNAWADVSGATGASFTTPTLTTTTYYRAVYNCTGDDCDEAISNVETVTVVNDPAVNITGGDVTICTGGNVVLTANVSGGTGSISYQWQDSPDNVTFNNISGATAQTYNTGALTTTTYFRVIITFTGNGCESQTSTTAGITVVPDPNVTVFGGDTICTGGNIILNAIATGGTGTCTLQWQYLNSGVWLNIPGATSANYTTPNLTETTQYRARYTCTGGGCDLATSPAAIVVVQPDPTVTISVPNNEICVGAGVTLTATPSGGLGTCTLQWQSSPDGSTWTDISGANGTSYTTPALNSNLFYQVKYECDRAGCCE